MAIIKSRRDERVRADSGIDQNINSQTYHNLVESRSGTTSKVNKLQKKYVLNKTPVIIDTTRVRKF